MRESFVQVVVELENSSVDFGFWKSAAALPTRMHSIKASFLLHCCLLSPSPVREKGRKQEYI